MSDAVAHGSRWLHAQPDEDEVKTWFEKQPLHSGMNHGPYMGGIVLIGATEKVKETRRNQGGNNYVTEIERVVYVPYVRVDTRISYFHDLARALSGDEPFKYVAVTEPVPQERIEDPASPYFNANLPEGFGILPVRNQGDSVSRFLVATYRAKIIERESPYKVPVLQGVGSKQTALARKYADDNAIMKAETGAIGRALGVAGILVVGTGVATAEDMQEAAAGPSGSLAASTDAALPPVEIPSAAGGAAVPAEGAPERALPLTEDETDEAMRERARALQVELERDFPQAWGVYRDWWSARGFGPLAEVYGAALRGALVKLERDLDNAKTQKLAEASI